MIADPTILINIVLYNHDKDKVLELIRICSHYEQAKILLFDNAPGTPCLECAHSEKIILYKSEKNVGVAGAYYYACNMAEKENFDFVLFLDQDSLLPADFINAMISGFYSLQKKYPRLSAIGPSWQDSRVNNDYGENNLRKKKWYIQKKEKILDLLGANNTIISSGMLIWVPTLKHIGYPKKEYFIDLVDIEWCLRAYSKNFHIKKLNHIQIQHDLGEIKLTKNKILNYQKPIRYYYSIRNSFILFREKQFPFWFRFYVLMKNLKEMQKIPFVPESRKSLTAALHGLKDGFFIDKKSFL